MFGIAISAIDAVVRSLLRVLTVLPKVMFFYLFSIIFELLRDASEPADLREIEATDPDFV